MYTHKVTFIERKTLKFSAQACSFGGYDIQRVKQRHIQTSRLSSIRQEGCFGSFMSTSRRFFFYTAVRAHKEYGRAQTSIRVELAYI